VSFVSLSSQVGITTGSILCLTELDGVSVAVGSASVGIDVCDGDSGFVGIDLFKMVFVCVVSVGACCVQAVISKLTKSIIRIIILRVFIVSSNQLSY
jgi:hypothetical protein